MKLNTVCRKISICLKFVEKVICYYNKKKLENTLKTKCQEMKKEPTVHFCADLN